MDEDRFKRCVSRRGGGKEASINLLQHMGWVKIRWVVGDFFDVIKIRSEIM
jgi:hypothetical protein